MQYKYTVYSNGYSLKVTPEDRGVDVMHHLITGGLLGGKSLDGVEWEEVEPSPLVKQRGDMIRKSYEKGLDEAITINKLVSADISNLKSNTKQCVLTASK